MSNTWSFNGIPFRRLSPSDSDPQWFVSRINFTTDVAVGDTGATAQRWVDRGGREVEKLQLTAGCETDGTSTGAVKAAALEALLGEVRTLVNVTGRSAQALLVRADPLIVDGGPFRQVALEFEFVQ